jgi:hypothetical protein
MASVARRRDALRLAASAGKPGDVVRTAGVHRGRRLEEILADGADGERLIVLLAEGRLNGDECERAAARSLIGVDAALLYHIRRVRQEAM